MNDAIRCELCGREVATVEEAMEAGWEPSFWITETVASGGPACPHCSVNYLEGHADEPTLKPGVTKAIVARDNGGASV